MSRGRDLSRRDLLQGGARWALGAAAGSVLGGCASRRLLDPAQPEIAEIEDLGTFIQSIRDPEIRAGVDAAIHKNLLPAAVQEAYPGHFNISADGGAYGGWATWPGLDSWQMAGAYLLLGGPVRRRLVLDYFDFVRASQRPDGNIPFAIFTGDNKADGGYLNGLRNPEDVFSYAPPQREDLPASSLETRAWIGLFTHWQPKADPLSALGATCYLLTGAEIFDFSRDQAWLQARLPSLEAAAQFLKRRTSPNGLIPHSGFYVELPPRYGWDGITQCYVIHAYRELARLQQAAGDAARGAAWRQEAARLTEAFIGHFWREDHFGEYVHEERGLVDSHGLSDVNWAAVAFGVADDARAQALWPRLTGDPGFWWGGMPTLTVTKPFSYETWEYHEDVPMDVPPLNDVAAMGRAWYLEALACRRMGAHERLIEGTRRVCAAANADGGYWRERYQPQPDGSTLPARAAKYCEYPAVLLRVVLGNPGVYCGA